MSNNVAWLGCTVYGRRNELNEIKSTLYVRRFYRYPQLFRHYLMLLHNPPNQTMDYVTGDHPAVSRWLFLSVGSSYRDLCFVSQG